MSRSETLRSFGTQTSAISRAFRAEHLGHNVKPFATVTISPDLSVTRLLSSLVVNEATIAALMATGSPSSLGNVANSIMFSKVSGAGQRVEQSCQF